MMQNYILSTINPHSKILVLLLLPMKVTPWLLSESSSRRHPHGINMQQASVLKLRSRWGGLHFSFPDPGGVQGHHQLILKLYQINSSLKSRESYGNSFPVKKKHQVSFLLSDLTGMYHYTGSLTTPGCEEIVQWIILDTPLHVNKNLVTYHPSGIIYYTVFLAWPCLKNCSSKPWGRT